MIKFRNFCMNNKTFLYAAGGTAGHVYPAQGIAEHKSHSKINHILLTDIRGAKFADPNIFSQICILPIKRAKMLRTFWKTVVISHKCFKNKKISGVFILGGYVSLIPALIAFFKNIPIYVIETNSIMGKANKLISKISKKIFTTFDLKSKFPSAKQIGFFVRKEITSGITLGIQPQINPIETVKHDTFNILILGSSVGAYLFAEKIPAVFTFLSSELKQRISITQHTPTELQQKLSQTYSALQITHNLQNFIENIQEEMQKADLIISRAGASTISEACVMGKFMILIPYKKAADDHQTTNAKIIEKMGYAHTISEDDFDPKALAEYISQLMSKTDPLPPMPININGCKQIWEEL